jgi:hypothetical protein
LHDLIVNLSRNRPAKTVVQAFSFLQQLTASAGSTHIRAAAGKPLPRVDGNVSFFVAGDTQQFRFACFAPTSQASPFRDMSHNFPRLSGSIT